MRLEEFSSYDATGLAELIARRDVSAGEVARLALQGIHQVDGHLDAVIETYPERAEDTWLEGLAPGPLRGVPILNKDLSFAEAGRPMEMGSLLAAGFVPSEDSTAFRRLRDAGLVNLGRTTTPEFGQAGITESRIAGVTRNPWDLARTPGGSSGGSAAMVAAGVVPVATASDGGGSTRGPAAYCGLVGLKQTRGRIPLGPQRSEGNNGLSAPFVLTRSVRDCALLLDLMSGGSPGDPYEVAPPVRPFREEVGAAVPALRVAYMEDCWSGRSAEPPCREGLQRALRLLEADGHAIEEARPEFDWSRFFDATVVVWCANLARGIDVLAAGLKRRPGPDNLQSSTFACYERGKTITAGELLGALEEFNKVNRTVGRFFESFDLLVTPTHLRPAPLIDRYYRCDPNGPVDAVAWMAEIYESESLLPLFNTTGQPAISLPLHQTDQGVPLGVQFVARFGDEATLIRLASFFESATPWAGRLPAVHVSRDERS